MRALLLSAFFAAMLGGCGGARDPSAEASAQEPARVLGQFKATSDSLRARTGDLGIERGGLIFSGGAVLYTRTLAPRAGADLVAAGGDTYAAIALGASDLRVELRRVTDATEAASLCAEGAPAYVALVHEARPTAVTLLVFTGDEPPGPEATRSRLCASFAYTAPHGARTREGVVLW